MLDLLFLIVIAAHLQVQFRAAVARMELLLEEESRDSASALTGLRDQALLVKNRQAADDTSIHTLEAM